MKDHDEVGEEPRENTDLEPDAVPVRGRRRRSANLALGAVGVLGGITIAMSLAGHGSNPRSALPAVPPSGSAVPAAAVSSAGTPTDTFSLEIPAVSSGQASGGGGSTKAAAPADLTSGAPATTSAATPTPTEPTTGPGVPTAPATVPSVSASPTDSPSRKPTAPPSDPSSPPTSDPTTSGPAPSPTVTYTQW